MLVSFFKVISWGDGMISFMVSPNNSNKWPSGKVEALLLITDNLCPIKESGMVRILHIEGLGFLSNEYKTNTVLEISTQSALPD